MELIKKIQDSAIDSNENINILLRKCKVLSEKLNNYDFKIWVDNELNGYETTDLLPPYRIIYAESFGDFFGPLGFTMRNAPIPPSCVPKEYVDRVSKVYFMNAISFYSSLLEEKEEKGSEIQEHWPADLIAMVSNNIYTGKTLGSAWKPISRSSIYSFIETVRNKILNFTIELENSYSSLRDGGDDSMVIPSETIGQIFNLNIYGDVKNLAAGSQNFSQTVKQIEHNNFDNLKKFLESLGVTDNDLVELKSAIDSDETPVDSNNFGEKVNVWLGKIVTKASNGLLNVGSSTATNLIVSALSSYFGLN